MSMITFGGNSNGICYSTMADVHESFMYDEITDIHGVRGYYCAENKDMKVPDFQWDGEALILFKYDGQFHFIEGAITDGFSTPQILARFEEMVDEIQERERVYGEPSNEDILKLKAKAQRIFDRTNFRTYMIEDMIGWGDENENNRQALIEFVKTERLVDIPSNGNEFEEELHYIADKDLIKFCDSHNIAIDRPFIVYLQNDDYYDEYWNTKEFVEGLNGFINDENHGLYAIVMHDRDGVFLEGIINEDFKKNILEKINVLNKEAIGKDNKSIGR